MGAGFRLSCLPSVLPACDVCIAYRWACDAVGLQHGHQQQNGEAPEAPSLRRGLWSGVGQMRRAWKITSSPTSRMRRLHTICTLQSAPSSPPSSSGSQMTPRPLRLHSRCARVREIVCLSERSCIYDPFMNPIPTPAHTLSHTRATPRLLLSKPYRRPPLPHKPAPQRPLNARAGLLCHGRCLPCPSHHAPLPARPRRVPGRQRGLRRRCLSLDGGARHVC